MFWFQMVDPKCLHNQRTHRGQMKKVIVQSCRTVIVLGVGAFSCLGQCKSYIPNYKFPAYTITQHLINNYTNKLNGFRGADARTQTYLTGLDPYGIASYVGLDGPTVFSACNGDFV